MQGLKSEDGKTRDGSRFFLQQLLAAPQPSPAAAGATANGHGGGGGAAEQCLAAEVLATQTDTQHWLRNTAAAFRAGTVCSKCRCRELQQGQAGCAADH